MTITLPVNILWGVGTSLWLAEKGGMRLYRRKFLKVRPPPPLPSFPSSGLCSISPVHCCLVSFFGMRIAASQVLSQRERTKERTAARVLEYSSESQSSWTTTSPQLTEKDAWGLGFVLSTNLGFPGPDGETRRHLPVKSNSEVEVIYTDAVNYLPYFNFGGSLRRNIPQMRSCLPRSPSFLPHSPSPWLRWWVSFPFHQ